MSRKAASCAHQLLDLKTEPCPAVGHAARDPQLACPWLQHRDIKVVSSHASNNHRAAILTAPGRPPCLHHEDEVNAGVTRSVLSLLQGHR